MLLLWLGLEEFSAGRRMARLAALGLAAVLPSALHLDGMATNESLSALFSFAATLFIPTALGAADERRRRLAGVGLGIALGLALLSKVSVAVVGMAFAIGVGLDLVWRWRAGLRGLRSLVARLEPALLAALLAATLSGWFFVRNENPLRPLAPTGYDGPAHVVVDEMSPKTPYLESPHLRLRLRVHGPNLPRPLLPERHRAPPALLSILIAGTFVDSFNFGFAPHPTPGQPSLTRHSRPMSRTAYDLSRASVLGGALVALAVVIAGLACWRVFGVVRGGHACAHPHFLLARCSASSTSRRNTRTTPMAP